MATRWCGQHTTTMVWPLLSHNIVLPLLGHNVVWPTHAHKMTWPEYGHKTVWPGHGHNMLAKWQQERRSTRPNSINNQLIKCRNQQIYKRWNVALQQSSHSNTQLKDAFQQFIKNTSQEYPLDSFCITPSIILLHQTQTYSARQQITLLHQTHKWSDRPQMYFTRPRIILLHQETALVH